MLLRFTKLLSVCWLLIPGCAATKKNVVINSYTLIQDVWELDSAKIRELASFDLACPSPSLELTVLDQAVYANGNVAMRIGVAGCGKRGVYEQVEGYSTGRRWRLNSTAR